MLMSAVATTTFVLASTPLPSPHPSSSGSTPDVDADLVTPGLYGFVTLFLSALAVFFLARSMARRVQRMTYRARLEAEAAEREAAEGDGSQSNGSEGNGSDEETQAPGPQEESSPGRASRTASGPVPDDEPHGPQPPA